jgi:hypothetical protein
LDAAGFASDAFAPPESDDELLAASELELEPEPLSADAVCSR